MIDDTRDRLATEGEGWARLYRDYLQRVSGISTPPEKSYLFETRLSKMMHDSGARSLGELYCKRVNGGGPDMEQEVINAMSTNETLWFRDKAPWLVIERELLPRLVEELRAGRKRRIRIWHAASSTGQEAYSTVMCVDDFLARHNIRDVTLSDFEFLATDISTLALGTAKEGLYDQISIARGLDARHRDKYFTREGATWRIQQRLREAVRFERHNLQGSCAAFGAFDIIFLRYVLIYFDASMKQETVNKMQSALLDGGTLFTGNYALLGIFDEGFDSLSYGNMTYYVKKTAAP